MVVDTLLTALERGDQLRDPEKLRPWLLRIATNRALGVRRSSSRVVQLHVVPDRAARRTDEDSRAELRAMQGVDVLTRSDGTLLALFESPYWLERLEKEHPDLTLERLIAEGELRQ